MRRDNKSKRKTLFRKKSGKIRKNKIKSIKKKHTKRKTMKQKKKTNKKSIKHKKDKLVQSGGGFKVAIDINDGHNKLLVITRDFNNFDSLLKFADISDEIRRVIGRVFVHYPTQRYGYETNWVRNSVCEHVHYVLWLKYGNKLFLAPPEIQHKIVKVSNISGAKDNGESIKDCAIRELKEEIGHNIEPGDIIRIREGYIDNVKISVATSGAIIDRIHGIGPNKEELKVFNRDYIKDNSNMADAIDENVPGILHSFVSVDNETLTNLIMRTYKLESDGRSGLENYLSTKKRSKLGFETIGTVIGNMTKDEINAQIIGQYRDNAWVDADTVDAKKIARDILNLYGKKLSIYISSFDRHKSHGNNNDL